MRFLQHRRSPTRPGAPTAPTSISSPHWLRRNRLGLESSTRAPLRAIRPSSAPTPRPRLAHARADDGRAHAGGGPLARSASRSALAHVPDRPLGRRRRRLPDAPRLAEADALLEALEARRPRSAFATVRWSNSSTRAGSAAQSGRPRPRRRRLRAGGSCTCAARATRSGSSRWERRPLQLRGTCATAAGPRARRQRRSLPLGPRAAAGHQRVAPPAPNPAPAPPRLRDASARGRRRPAHDPGAPRPRLALDDPGLQPRGRASPSAASTTARIRDPDPSGQDAGPNSVRGRPVRRELPALSRRGARPAPSTRTGATSPRSRLPRMLTVDDASVEEIETLARRCGRDGLAPSTLARRAAAVRAFFRHQVLIGAARDNPAAEVDLPRRPRGCRARSPPARPSA